MNKIPPSMKIRKEINEILEGKSEELFSGKSPFTILMHKAKLLLAQELLEKEVKDFLGRGYYQRDLEASQRKGYRNGYEPKTIKTPEDKLTIQIPQLRDTQQPFESRLKQFFRNNTDVLEKLACEMYIRGLSTRDIEDAFLYATGDRILSKSTVSEVTEILWQDYENFAKRDLSKYEVIYIVVDAIYEPLRPYIQTNEAILVAHGILTDGRKILLHMELGNKESYEFCKGFFYSMVNRGLNTPLSITSDGAPGLIKAIDEVFPRSLRLRCWVHKMQNLCSKVPEEIWARIKPEIQAIRDALDMEEGQKKLDEFVSKHNKAYPSLVSCLLDDREALLNHLLLPYRHRKAIRSTNLVERAFVEENRRTKVIPQFLTERSCLKLCFAILYRASLNWRRIPMNSYEVGRINTLRKELGIEIPSFATKAHQPLVEIEKENLSSP